MESLGSLSSTFGSVLIKNLAAPNAGSSAKGLLRLYLVFAPSISLLTIELIGTTDSYEF